jgi:hypothetical protein
MPYPTQYVLNKKVSAVAENVEEEDDRDNFGYGDV